MDEFKENFFTSEEGHFKPTPRTILFFILSTALLIIYGIQKGKIETQIVTWIIFLLIFSCVSYFGPRKGFINTFLLLLIGVSGGMVISNATISVTA